jgi:hypothetical protein
MKWLSLKILFLLFLFTSCHGNNFQKSQKIAKFKAEDDAFCTSLGLNPSGNPIVSEVYWRCRIALAKRRLTFGRVIPEFMRQNSVLQIYISELRAHFEQSFENLNDYRNSFISQRDHELCQRQGLNDDDDFNFEKVEKYIKCRKELIKVAQVTPPYDKTQYFDRPTQDSYNIGFVINQRQDRKIAEIEDIKKQYPNCFHLGIKSDEFPKCKEDYNRKNLCYKAIAERISEKNMKERISCQKKLYVRFSDSMAKKDDIDDKILVAQIYEQNDLRSLGLSEKDIASFYPEEKKPKKIDETASKNFNTENELYTKGELTMLKKKYIVACNQEIPPLLNDLKKRMEMQCEQITLKWQNSENEQ